MFELPDRTGRTSIVVDESDILGDTSPEIRPITVAGEEDASVYHAMAAC